MSRYNSSFHPRLTAAPLLGALLLAPLLIGCGGGDAAGGSPPPPAASITGESGNSGPVGENPSGGNFVSDPAGGVDEPVFTGGAPRATPARPPRDPHPEVVIHTSQGDITITLEGELAPTTVDNFLETYVDRGFYNDTIFHYVEKDYMILGGGFTADMELKPARAPIFNEAHNGLKNTRGTIAMARDAADIHSATSQFYFNLADNPHLDHKSRENLEEYGYCVFGKVTGGLEVLDRIAAQPVDGDTFAPVTPIVITGIERVKK